MKKILLALAVTMTVTANTQASLDAKTYITTSPETLLYKTLEDVGRKDPQILFSEWRAADKTPTAPKPSTRPSATPSKPECASASPK